MKIKIADKEDELILLPEVYAYRDGTLYPIYRTARTYTAGCYMGWFTYVIDNDKILATAYPMFNFDNGFEKVTEGAIQNYVKIVAAYNKFKEQLPIKN